MFSRFVAVGAFTASLAAGGLLGPQSAQAMSPQSDTFDVTATIIAACTISASDLAFGNYDPLLGTPTDGTSTVSVTCSTGAPYDITLDGGLAADTANRTMDDDATGTEFLGYQLYSDNPRTTVWGNTAADDVSGTGTGANQDITVYGRIPAGQTGPSVGDYTDTITAEITF